MNNTCCYRLRRKQNTEMCEPLFNTPLNEWNPNFDLYLKIEQIIGLLICVQTHKFHEMQQKEIITLRGLLVNKSIRAHINSTLLCIKSTSY